MVDARAHNEKKKDKSEVGDLSQTIKGNGRRIRAKKKKTLKHYHRSQRHPIEVQARKSQDGSIK